MDVDLPLPEEHVVPLLGLWFDLELVWPIAFVHGIHQFVRIDRARMVGRQLLLLIDGVQLLFLPHLYRLELAELLVWARTCVLTGHVSVAFAEITIGNRRSLILGRVLRVNFLYSFFR